MQGGDPRSRLGSGHRRRPWRSSADESPSQRAGPERWWAALVDAFGEVGSVAGQVAAIGVGGQQHGMVVLDADNRPLRPAKLWNDTESAAEAARLTEAVGAETWAARVGSVPVASFTISKLAWLVQHEPDLVGRIAKVLLPHDYVNLRLTGVHATDRGDASGSGWFDARTGECAAELLELLGGRDDWASLVPAVLGPTEVLGTVTGEAAAALGVPEGIPVGPGSGDNMAAALGLGLTTGDVALSLGTSGVVYAASPTPTADPSGECGLRRRHGRLPAARVHPQRHKVTDTVAGWLGMDHETFGAQQLDAPAGAHGAGSPPISTASGHPTCPMQRARSKGFATTRRQRIWPELPMKGCFAACSSDVRPWPPQEQRSMGECT